MTFFLNDPQAQIDIQARGTDTPLTSLWGGISASVQKEQLESNANFRTGRERIATDDELAVEAARHMGADRVGAMVEAFNERARAAGMAERQMPADLADLPSIFGPNFSKAVLDEARNDPDWTGPDVSPEAAQKRTDARMQKEHQDLTETLNAMGGGRWVAEIVGGVVGATADVRNLIFLAAGGGTGSIARVMGREAMLNVAAEGATMPDRFKMAERLNIPEPDVAMTLAYAAAGGALLGGAVEGLARGITYWRGTRTAQRTDIPRYEQEAGANAAEDAIADVAKPFERIDREAARTTAVEVAPAARSVERPVAAPDAVSAPPRSDPLSDLFDQPEARGGVGERQMDLEELISEAQARDPVAQDAPNTPAAQPAPVESVQPVLTASTERELHRASGGSKPLTDHIKRVYGGIQPGTRLAAELNARGITSKTAPGLFRKSGRPGFDNIPAAEEPHLAAVLGDDGNGYLSEDALAGAIIDEAGGIPMPVSREQVDARVELDERRAEQERLDREAAVAAGQELDDQLFRLPEAPGWVDVPKEREAILEYRTDDLRTKIAKGPAVVAVDKDKSQFINTRGQGVRYHGSKKANTGISEGHYSSLNYYGNGLYTTDAVAIGHGYAGGDKGFLYEIKETAPINALDMEAPVPDFLVKAIREEGGELERDALDEGPANLRELFDNIRDISSSTYVSADEVQEIFEAFYYDIRRAGFNALDHTGGLRTTKEPHSVRIYLEPENTIRLEQRGFDEFKAPEKAPEPAAPAQQTVADSVVDMGDGLGPRPMSAILDELDADNDFAEMIQMCGRRMPDVTS